MDTGEEKDGPLRMPWIRFQGVGTGANFSHAEIPAPYPTTPPVGQETADAYYVVDHGREVGIFIDKYVVLFPDVAFLTRYQHTIGPRHHRCPSRSPSQSEDLVRRSNALQLPLG